MRSESSEVFWMSEQLLLSSSDLANLSGLSEEDLNAFTTAGIVQPATPGAEPKMFSACCVDKLKTACRLRDDLELDMHALSVTCSLLERIRQLESELHALQARLPDVRPSLRY